MQRAVSGANTEELRRAAHSLKSNSATFGARALAGMCQELENQAKEGVLEGAAERLVRVEAAFADAERQLRALRPSRLTEG
jgi:two-component system, sensor histidine kinase and response regulator